jgi:hypothetical protein
LSIFLAFVTCGAGAGSGTSTKKLHRFANHLQF